MYDLVIVGGGPAGMAAAIYAGRARLDAILLEAYALNGGQIINTLEIENYPGFLQIDGAELAMKLEEHVKSIGVPILVDGVSRIEQMQGGLRVMGEKQSYESKAVSVATGAGHRKLGAPGEDEFAGRGVSYCATCDGAFYKNRSVAVVGGGNTAVKDALYLSRMCEKVYVIHRRDELRAERILQERLFALENVEVLWDTVVEEICGGQTVQALKLKNKKTDSQKDLSVAGVFIAVGLEPHSTPFRDLLETDQAGFIRADETGQTNIPGIFVAGDVRTKQMRQIVTAVSDGCNAVASVEEYLNA